jgi:putative membrane protein
MRSHMIKLPVLLCSCALFAVGCADRRMDMGGAADPGVRGTGYGTTTRTATADYDTARTAQADLGIARVANADAQFVQDAAAMGLAEVQLGELVQQHAQSEALREFGQTLASEHSQANQELAALAALKTIELPMQIRAEDRQALMRLRSASGAEFDRLAKQEAINAHQKAIRHFENAQMRVQDPELRAFIDQNLPTLQEHLEQAQNLPITGAPAAHGGSDMLEDTEIFDLEDRRPAREMDQLSPGRQPEPDAATPTIPE